MPSKGCEAWAALVKVFDIERVVNVSQHLLVEALRSRSQAPEISILNDANRVTVLAWPPVAPESSGPTKLADKALATALAGRALATALASKAPPPPAATLPLGTNAACRVAIFVYVCWSFAPALPNGTIAMLRSLSSEVRVVARAA